MSYFSASMSANFFLWWLLSLVSSYCQLSFSPPCNLASLSSHIKLAPLFLDLTLLLIALTRGPYPALFSWSPIAQLTPTRCMPMAESHLPLLLISLHHFPSHSLSLSLSLTSSPTTMYLSRPFPLYLTATTLLTIFLLLSMSQHRTPLLIVIDDLKLILGFSSHYFFDLCVCVKQMKIKTLKKKKYLFVCI